MKTPKFIPPSQTDMPELFFALVGPTGTDLDAVTNALKAELSIVGYSLAEPVRLSGLIAALPGHEDLHNYDGPEDERIEAFMDAGDQVRKSWGHAGALAALAVDAIRRTRDSNEAKPATAFPRRSRWVRSTTKTRSLFVRSLVSHLGAISTSSASADARTLGVTP